MINLCLILMMRDMAEEEDVTSHKDEMMYDIMLYDN